MYFESWGVLALTVVTMVQLPALLPVPNQRVLFERIVTVSYLDR